MKKLQFTFLTSLALVLFTACDAGNEWGYGYNDWDLDEDEIITTEEYNEAWGDVGHYEGWDENEDAYIDREEWEQGVEEHYADWSEEKRESMDFDEWDANQDGQLSHDELADGTFNLWDADGDGQIDVVEYEEFNRPS